MPKHRDSRRAVDKLPPQVANEIGRVIWDVQSHRYGNLADRVDDMHRATNEIALEVIKHMEAKETL